MRVMSNKSLALTLAIGLAVGFILPVQPGWAKKKPQTELVKNESVNLGDLRSFGIYDMPKHDFAATRDENVPAEVVEYTRTALQSDKRLSYKSPADGMLHFYCDNTLCTRFKIELTHGPDGPVVWRTIQNYRFLPGMEFHFAPNNRKFAQKVVDLLADDYQKTIKPVPEKIQIKED
jgi:hypothetical protein